LEEKRILKNGIELISLEGSTAHSFFISLYLRAGVLHEAEGECGISHFLEHIAIRNVNKIMGGSLYRTLDRCGIEFNAATYQELVQFYASGSPKAFKTAAEAISALLCPIALTAKEISLERERIKAEIREADEAGSLAAFTQSKVWENTPLCRMITGTRGDVSKISAKRLREFHSEAFSEGNVTVYLTGTYSAEDIDTLAALLEGHTLKKAERRENIAKVPEAFGKRGGKAFVKNDDFCKLKFTFDMDMSKISVPESDLLYEILFGAYASPFFLQMSEEKGIFYDLTGSVERYKNIGTIGFSFETRQDRLYEAVETAVAIIERLKVDELSEEDCMKAGFVDNGEMLLDEPRELNFTLAYDNCFLGCGYASLNERINAYKAVSPQKLRERIKEIFTADNLTLTLKGNAKKIDTSRLEAIIRTLSH